MTTELYIYIYIYIKCTYCKHCGRRSPILQNPSGSIHMSVCPFSNQFSKLIVSVHLSFQFIHNGLLFIESELKVLIGNTKLSCSASSFLETMFYMKENDMGCLVLLLLLTKKKYILRTAHVLWSIHYLNPCTFFQRRTWHGSK